MWRKSYSSTPIIAVPASFTAQHLCHFTIYILISYRLSTFLALLSKAFGSLMVAAWSSCCFQRHQLTRLMVVLLQKAASFSSMESFSPTLPLAHAHPKAALGILIFILMLPFQSLLLLKTFFNLNFNNAFHRTLQWLPSLPVLYKPVLPFPCALAAADKRFSSLHCQSHSSVLNPVRLFINHYFESSNDHRAVCVLPSQARALQSAPTCVLLT